MRHQSRNMKNRNNSRKLERGWRVEMVSPGGESGSPQSLAQIASLLVAARLGIRELEAALVKGGGRELPIIR
jgi:hypothetical protein